MKKRRRRNLWFICYILISKFGRIKGCCKDVNEDVREVFDYREAMYLKQKPKKGMMRQYVTQE